MNSVIYNFDGNRKKSRVYEFAQRYEADSDGSMLQKAPESTPIQQFFAGQSILVTGGTGFLGKVLIEKLLRVCPEIKTIYAIVRKNTIAHPSSRPKKKNLKNEVIFKNLAKEIPDFQNKIEVIHGELDAKGLNLSEQDRDLLVETVSVVFHVAATVKFYEKIEVATRINVGGTYEVLELSKSFKNLKSFVYVSTAFVHSHLKYIPEDVHQHTFTYDQLFTAIDRLPKNFINQVGRSNFTKPWLSTYNFTKALAEEVVELNGKGLPVAIFRPSMVLSSYKEPIPGWIGNLYGPTGLIIQAMMGIYRVYKISPSRSFNCIPVDYTVNALIASAYDVTMQTEQNSRTMVYNYVAPRNQTLTWKKFLDIVFNCAKKYPPSEAIYYCDVKIYESPIARWLAGIFFESIPLMIMDLYSRYLLKKDVSYRKLCKKMDETFNTVLGVAPTDPKWVCDNVKDMWQRLDPRDKDLFNFDMTEFNWEEYLELYVKGIRQYLLKDDLDSVNDTCVRLNDLHRTFVTYLCVALVIGVPVIFIFIRWIMRTIYD